ncbi:MAG: qorA [Rickettsiaceae bacterium]|jgi:NADPH2:quinone reductase|nr:qorA [Rickettsiaceae bacterium]
MKAFVLSKQGKSSNLELKNVDNPVPQREEVVVRHTAIGINYFDVCFRNGAYQLSNIPAILGLEACGVVEEVGKGVRDYKVGDRVAYATGPIGAYCEKRAINQAYLVSPPPSLSDEQVAGSLLKAMMAHALLFRVYIASQARRILVHGAAGGVGHFLCMWAKHLGLEVIGTVGSDAKIAMAKSFGCDHVINYRSKDFLLEVEQITNGQGVGLVYDGIGKDTILKSIDCLWPMGMCVSYGEASGPTPPIDLNALLLNSLYITRPLLALYKAKRIELVLSAAEVFKAIENGVLKPHITAYNFKDIPKVHDALEGRSTTGSLVVKL